MNFWDQDIFENPSVGYNDLESEVDSIATEILESSLNQESIQLSVMVSGYIAKKLIERMQCDACKYILLSKDGHVEVDDSYIKLISRGGLYTPSKELSDFVSHAFAALDILDKYIIKYPSQNYRKPAILFLQKYLGEDDFCCEKHINGLCIYLFY